MKKTKVSLEDLAGERAALPDKIASAALSGNIDELTNLRKRQGELEVEIFIAECAKRQSEIEELEARRREASERASQARSQLSADMPRLTQELAVVKERALKIPGEMRSIHSVVDRAQREVDAINSRIEDAKQQLAAYIEKTSKPPAQAAA
jgi:predicted  nucleic acid-binding Zn-ribbon protein